MSRKSEEKPALPDLLTAGSFYPDRPGRPGSGRAMAEAVAAFSSAARGDGPGRCLAFAAELGELEGGATVLAGQELPPILKVGNFNLPGGVISVSLANLERDPAGILRLAHPDGRVSRWRVR